MTPVQQLNACSSSDITAFVTACASSTATSTTCQGWTSNTAYASCWGCIDQVSGGTPTNAGAVITDAAGVLFNVPGCVALVDTSNGTACAQALAPLQECDDAACLDCYTGGTASPDLGTCYSNAEMGACASYYGSASSLCTSEYEDGGAATTCQDATTIVNVFCGTGS